MHFLKQVLIALGCILILTEGCTADQYKRDVSGPYQTWNDVIERWVGGEISHLYLELGPPNRHPQERPNGITEMVWDYNVDRMPGQADEYHLLPLSFYGGGIDCQIHFLGDSEGIIREGYLVGPC